MSKEWSEFKCYHTYPYLIASCVRTYFNAFYFAKEKERLI
jgi:hypothetical protein